MTTSGRRGSLLTLRDLSLALPRFRLVVRSLALALTSVVLLTLVLASDARTSGAEPDAAAPSPHVPTTPTTKLVECPVPVPDSAWCGELIVPEKRTRPDGPKVRLPYVVVPAADPRPGTPPLVTMNGGPGSPSLGLAGYWASLDLAAHRDVVLLEQRGGRLSAPSLACPAADEAYVAMLTTTDPTSTEALPVAGAMRDCQDDFVADGHDPAGYTVAETAGDVRDLRIALGYPAWIAYGVSWSTRVMAKATELDAQGITAVVLDSFLAPEQDAAEVAHHGLRHSLDTIAKSAGTEFADPYGDLMTAAAQLDERPASAAATNPVTNEPMTLRLTGTDLIAVVHAALYDVELIPIVPHVVHQLASGDRTVLETLVPVGIDELVSHSLGQYWTMQCQDEVPYDAPIGDDPRAILWLAVDEVVCPRLGLPPSPFAERVPVSFSQPTLVLAGADDPVTPPDIADSTSAGLRERTYLDFAGTGHAVFLSSRCGREIIAEWLDHPERDVATVCDRSNPAYPVVQADDVHSSTAVGQFALAAERGSFTALLLPVVWIVMCSAWLLGASGAAAWASARRRSVGRQLSTAVPAAAGVAYTFAFGWAILDTLDSQPMLLAIGVPAWTLWLLVLPAAGFVVLLWQVWQARHERRRWALLSCAALVWVAFLVWLTITIVIGEPVLT